MKPAIAAARLHNQRITCPRRCAPADIVAHFGAVQAQEYPAAKWALALRMSGTTRDDEVERAFDEGQILRTHILRPTWHFVTPADIRWMLALTGPHVQRRLALYYRRQGLDARTLTRATSTVERALREGRCLSRPEIRECLLRDRLDLGAPPMMLLMAYLELEGVVCSGPRRRKHHTYALLEERVPAAPTLSRDEAIAELARRYFTSHGPATVRDFVWWSGLPTADAKRGLEINRARSEDVEGLTYWTLGRAVLPRRGRSPRVDLLPIYDEYLVAYRDRDAVPHLAVATGAWPGGLGTFQHAVVIDGQVAGTWKNPRSSRSVAVNVTTRSALKATERRALAESAERYGRFLDCPVSVSIPS